MEHQPVRFQLLDPRDGEYGVMYSAKTQAEMEKKADEAGATRFQGITPDNQAIQYIKKDGEWRQERLADKIAEGDRAADAWRLANDLKERVQHALKEDMHNPGTMHPEVRKAFDDMGIDPVKDTEHRASQAIESRSIAYADAVVSAKYEKLAALPQGDVAAKLEEMRRPEPGVLRAEVISQWAEVDARDFSRIQEPGRQEDAAVHMMNNVRACEGYGHALATIALDVAVKVARLDASAAEQVSLKEAGKNMDAPTLTNGREARYRPAFAYRP
jgi:hypothetical protein